MGSYDIVNYTILLFFIYIVYVFMIVCDNPCIIVVVSQKSDDGMFQNKDEVSTESSPLGS